jgi:hypothetical protein
MDTRLAASTNHRTIGQCILRRFLISLILSALFLLLNAALSGTLFGRPVYIPGYAGYIFAVLGLLMNLSPLYFFGAGAVQLYRDLEPHQLSMPSRLLITGGFALFPLLLFIAYVLLVRAVG